MAKHRVCWVGWSIENEDGSETDLAVKVDYYAGSPDVYYQRNGDPGWPGDPPEMEVLEVVESATKKSREDLVEGLQKSDLFYEQVVNEIDEDDRYDCDDT